MAAGSRTLKLQILAETAKLVDGLDKANKQVMTTGQKFQAGFAQVSKAVVAAGAAVGAFVGSSIKSYMEFDDKLTQSTAIMSGVTEDTRKQMETAARSVATTLGIAHKDAAESYYFLASAGLDAAQSIAALPQVAAFAKAGMFDMARATDLATDAQSALGLTSKDAAENLQGMTRVTDVLVRAATLANASVEQFGIALTTKAGTAMKTFGIDIEKGVAVLAAFADQGIKAQVAGVNFGIVVRDLTTKAIAKKEAFEKLNIAVFDASGNMRSISDIIKDMEVALDGASDAQAKQIMQMLGFSDKSASAIQSLIGLSDKIKAYEDALYAAGGVTGDVADKQMESMKNQMELLKARFEDFKITLAAEFTPELTRLMDYISETVLPFMEKYKDEIILTAKAVLGLAAAVIAINTGLKIYQAAVVAATVVTAAYNAVLFANPIGLVIAAVAALVASFVVLHNRVGGLKGAFEGFVNTLKSAWEWIKRVASAAGDFLGGIGSAIGRGLGSIGFGGGRATGGTVSRGNAYMVGERGPEMFVPYTAGKIVPNSGGTVINITGTIIDPEGTARAVQQVLQNSSARAGNLNLNPTLGLA